MEQPWGEGPVHGEKEDGAHNEGEDAARLCEMAKTQDRARAQSLGLQYEQAQR